jgi:hypothetical protein
MENVKENQETTDVYPLLWRLSKNKETKTRLSASVENTTDVYPSLWRKSKNMEVSLKSQDNKKC